MQRESRSDRPELELSPTQLSFDGALRERVRKMVYVDVGGRDGITTAEQARYEAQPLDNSNGTRGRGGDRVSMDAARRVVNGVWKESGWAIVYGRQALYAC